MPNWNAIVRRHIGPLNVDPARAEDILDELAQHVAQHFSELTAAGVPEPEATRRVLEPLREHARLAVEIARADVPRMVAPPPPTGRARLAGVLADARHAVRLLRRAPGFTAIVLVTLALGIGANAAIFSVVDAVLLRPLPYASANRLVTLGDADPDGTAGTAGFATVVDWRERLKSLEQIAIVRDWQTVVIANDTPERVNGMRVTANFFAMIGVQPAMGRDFRREDDTQAGWRVVILSDRMWRTRFNADPNIIDRPITMNGRPYTVVGVMPASFEPLISERFYQPAEMWAPLGYETSLPYACRTCQHLRAIGLLRPGAAVDGARQELQSVEAQLRREHPTEYSAGEAMAVTPLTEVLTSGVGQSLWLLMAAVSLLLLISCANVANLLLVRVGKRERELTLRVALGASRGRVVQQVLVESLVLGLAGAALAVAIAAMTVPLLTSLAPMTMARLTGAHVDVRVLGFSIALAILTGVAFGLIPAIRASRIDLQGAARGTRSRTASGHTSWTRRGLIAGEVALAVVLLAGAGLMIRSVSTLLNVAPGFDPRGILAVHVSFVGQRFADNAALEAAQNDVLERLRAVPGVAQAAVSGQVPLDGGFDRWGFHVQGELRGKNGVDDPSAERFSVTSDYFSVMKIPLVKGRLLTPQDGAKTEPVIVINEKTASEFWPGRDPLGARVRVGDAANGPWRTVVGVVGDVRHQALSIEPTPQMYIPQSQFTDSFVTFVARTSVEPASVAGDARRAVQSVVKDVPVFGIVPLETIVAKSVGARRFVMILLTLFGALALALTGIGVYGVISHSVAERTREFGIRSALGASAGNLIRLVLGSGMLVVLAGGAMGFVGALAGGRYLDAWLYSVSPRDPLVLASSLGALLVAALAAHAVPLVRALRIAPTEALRGD